MSNSRVGEQRVRELLYECLAEVNLERLDENQLVCDPATVLFGAGAALDSLDLVWLVVMFEQKIGDALGSEISLTDDRAMSERNSPFQTVTSLVAYTARLLKEIADAG